ncbi:hypothetical protein FY557_17645 [Chryseobacterium sp. SN22]|uniref:hypothetical protein n=1 Tax=Chryseobacterium sp. SN22 TaxID=2606431 RepID=UPI0011EBDE32|nr:hypothetical protein [Chryseobacterium sp. SN22]KAA0126474.1 hypothetical protein FY557_17645 [Chryseobacterium sp. SN22]
MNRKLNKIKAQNEAQQKKTEIYLMQAIALSNYCNLLNQINEVPRLDLVQMISNCEDLSKLIESNKMFLDQIKKSAG